MSNNFFQNQAIKSVLVTGYRTYARSLVTRSGPRIFVNSIPKAGTHLFTSILDEIPGIMNAGLHVRTHYVNALTSNNQRLHGFKLDVDKFDGLARTVRPGQYFSSHILWDEEAHDYFENAAFKTFFVTRDPRDVLVSSYHYVMGLRRHYLHDYMVSLKDPVDRYKFMLYARDEAPVKWSQRDLLENYVPWIAKPFVCHVKFEDLVGERGGGSEAVREATLERVFDVLGKDPGEELVRNRKLMKLNPTLRRGKIGSWKDELPSEIEKLTMDEIGDIVVGLGYE